MRIIDLLAETPHFAELQGRDGMACRVWQNPSKTEFVNALAHGHDTTGLRGLATISDLYVWQSRNLLHGDFERETGIEGLRLVLRSDEIQLNDETAAFPENFPFIFGDAEQAVQQDVADRRSVVVHWLIANRRISRLYPNGFRTNWYM